MDNISDSPYTFELLLSKSDDATEPYTLRITELPGFMTHGKTHEEATRNLPEAIDSYIASLLEAGEEIPSIFTKRFNNIRMTISAF